MENIKKCAILVRVSTERQDYERQITELSKIASSKNYIFEEEDIYSEKVSGFSKKEERLALNRLLLNIREGKKSYQMIFVSEISRITRDPSFGRKIVDELSDMGIPIYIQNIGLATIDEKGERSAIFNIIFQILLEFSKTEADYFKARSKSGLRESASMGRAGGSKNYPYGYYKDDNKMLCVKEEEAIIVKEIFDYSLIGLGTKKIANILNSRKIPTRYNLAYSGTEINFKKTNYNKEGSQFNWVDGVVYGILKNPIYKGERRFKEHSFKAPSIVSNITWEKIQVLLSEKFNNKIKTTKYQYLLKDIIKCGVCGRNYFGRYKDNGHDKFYMCSSRRNLDGNCGNKGISIEMAESLVWNVLKNSIVFYNKVNNSDFITMEKNSLLKLKEGFNVDNSELSKLQEEYNKIIILFRRGIYTESKMIKEQSKLQKNISFFQKEIDTKSKQIEERDREFKNRDSIGVYKMEINKIGDDRLRIKELIFDMIEKVIINSIDSNYYLISIYSNYVDEHTSVLLDKSKNRYFANEDLNPLNYNSKGILIDDIYQKIAEFISETNDVQIKNIETVKLKM